MGYPTDEDFSEAHGWSGHGHTGGCQPKTQWQKEQENFALSNAIMNKAEIPEGFQRVVFFGLALSGEVGEANNIIKKMWRDGMTKEKKWDLVEELADAYVYLKNLAHELGIDLEEATSVKFDAVVKRWPELMKEIENESS